MHSETFDLQPTHLRNDKVKLVPLKADDFNRLYQVAADPAIWAGHPNPNRHQEAEFKSSVFDGAVASKSAFLVFDAETDKLIGTTRFYDYEPDKRQIAIGYTFLAVSHWGGAYNVAMKKLLTDYAFQYVDTIILHVAQSNYRSQRAVEKIGAIRAKEIARTGMPYYEYAMNKESLSPL